MADGPRWYQHRHRPRTAWLFTLTLASALQVVAAPAVPADVPTDAALEAHLHQLSEELRCLVCQNQTLADSQSDLAIDLRNEVREQLRAGRSDDEVRRYLVARYGDFVLYNPPLKSSTWLLWFGPLLLLAGGLAALGLRWWHGRGAPEPVDAELDLPTP